MVNEKDINEYDDAIIKLNGLRQFRFPTIYTLKDLRTPISINVSNYIPYGLNGLGYMSLGHMSLRNMLNIGKSKEDKTVELEHSYNWFVKSTYADRFVIAILHRFYSEIASIDCVNNSGQTVFEQAESAFKRTVS